MSSIAGPGKQGIHRKRKLIARIIEIKACKHFVEGSLLAFLLALSMKLLFQLHRRLPNHQKQLKLCLLHIAVSLVALWTAFELYSGTLPIILAYLTSELAVRLLVNAK
jgi:hypothetical protein